MSLDAERAVLGTALIAPEAWSVAASTLRKEDFFRDAHQRIFAAMSALAQRGVALDWLMLKEELLRTGDLDEVGGPSYVLDLTSGVPKSTNVVFYAGVVREKARLRAIVAAAAQQAAEAYDAEDSAAVIVERALKRLDAVVDSPAGGLTSADAVVRDYVSALSGGTLGDPLLTGFADLDAIVGGFRRQDFVVVAARPSVGKTGFMLCVAEAMAQAGKGVLFVSLETGKQALGSRLLALRSGVPTSRVERHEATPEEYARVVAVMNAPPLPAPFHIEETAGTVTEVAAWYRRAREAGPVDCVAVDYLQLLIPERRASRDDTEVASVSHALKRLAKETGTVVVALSQLSRAPEARRDKRPSMADLRGSGAIEQDCDVGILLFREEMYSKQAEHAGIAEAIVAKHRNGPTGVARLQFQADLAAFRDLAF